MRHLFYCLVVMATATATFALDSPAVPPTQQLLVPCESGTWHLVHFVTRSIPEASAQLYGSSEAKTAAAKFRCIPVVRDIDPDTVEALETSGRKISVAELKKRVSSPQPVVVSGHGGMIPEYYAAVFKPGTIILGKLEEAHGLAPTSSSVRDLIPYLALTMTSPSGPLEEGAGSSDASGLPKLADQPAEPVLPFQTLGAPHLAFASREGTGVIKIRRLIESMAATKLTIRLNDSSASPERQVEIRRTSRFNETTALSWKMVRISVADGPDVSIDRAKEWLGSGETTVLISADGGPVFPLWLMNLKPRVLIVRGVILPPEIGFESVQRLRSMPPLVQPVGGVRSGPAYVPAADGLQRGYGSQAMPTLFHPSAGVTSAPACVTTPQKAKN